MKLLVNLDRAGGHANVLDRVPTPTDDYGRGVGQLDWFYLGQCMDISLRVHRKGHRGVSGGGCANVSAYCYYGAHVLA